MTRLKRGTKVRVAQFKGSIINPVFDYDDKKKVIAYRVTDGKRPSFWSVIPAYLVEEIKE